jgi:hypothetical protein
MEGIIRMDGYTRALQRFLVPYFFDGLLVHASSFSAGASNSITQIIIILAKHILAFVLVGNFFGR